MSVNENGQTPSVTPGELARKLGLSTAQTIYSKLRCGSIRAEKDANGEWRIPVGEVERLMQQQQKGRGKHARS